jgi:hypothetical protein
MAVSEFAAQPTEVAVAGVAEAAVAEEAAQPAVSEVAAQPAEVAVAEVAEAAVAEEVLQAAVAEEVQTAKVAGACRLLLGPLELPRPLVLPRST